MEDEVSSGDRFLGFLAYVGPLVLVPLLASRFGARQHRFVLFHTRQGLYLFSLSLILMSVVLGLFYLFNSVVRVHVLTLVAAVLAVMVSVVYLVATLLLALTTLQRKMWMLPVLGELAGER